MSLFLLAQSLSILAPCSRHCLIGLFYLDLDDHIELTLLLISDWLGPLAIVQLGGFREGAAILTLALLSSQLHEMTVCSPCIKKRPLNLTPEG